MNSSTEGGWGEKSRMPGTKSIFQDCNDPQILLAKDKKKGVDRVLAKLPFFLLSGLVRSTVHVVDPKKCKDVMLKQETLKASKGVPPYPVPTAILVPS